MKLIRKIFVLFLLFFIAFLLFAFGYYFSVTHDVSLKAEKLAFRKENISVYDNLETPVTAIFGDNTVYNLSLNEVPKKTQLAFINTEDKRFYTHHGFDYKRFVKAFISNLKSGSFEQGASTISQQLIKNTHLSQEKTLKRKLKEWKLTKALEKKYDKNEILEKYLSVIYFGHNCFGLRSASKFYFGKNIDELDLADSAILAGIVKSPNNYSPFKNPARCLQRKAVVLSLMQKNGVINEEEKQIALKKPLPEKPHMENSANGYMRFVFDELSTLSQAYNFTVGGNIQIYTYLDIGLQKELENIASEYTASDKNLTVLDTKTNGYKACVSTLGEVRRLPGSLLKPLLVYAPALENNLISPATALLDEKINYGGYAPNNYNGAFHGYLSARECVAKSLNIPAVKLLESLGVERACSYLDKLGLNIDKDDYSLALALGGMKNGFTFKDLLSAYSSLCSQGEYIPSGFISKIKIDGATVYTKPQTKTRVFSEETAYLMTDMLKSTAQTGTAKKLRSLPFDISAKTGTVGVEKGNTDAYALSYTTSDIAGVWLGNADNRFIDCTGGGTPCNLLLKINEYLYKEKPPENFKKPSGIVSVCLDKQSYLTSHALYLADEITPPEYRFNEVFKKENVPMQKSELFSNPAIPQPRVRFENKKTVIEFDENSPLFYEYKIERYDGEKNTLLYSGKYIPSYTDEDIQPNKKYIYTVTPIYLERVGKAVVLPSVSTNKGETPENSEILEKNWWDY